MAHVKALLLRLYREHCGGASTNAAPTTDCVFLSPRFAGVKEGLAPPAWLAGWDVWVYSLLPQENGSFPAALRAEAPSRQTLLASDVKDLAGALDVVEPVQAAEGWTLTFHVDVCATNMHAEEFVGVARGL